MEHLNEESTVLRSYYIMNNNDKYMLFLDLLKNSVAEVTHISVGSVHTMKEDRMLSKFLDVNLSFFAQVQIVIS